MISFMLICIVVSLLIYIVIIKKELKNISKQIEKNKGEYINIHTKSTDKTIEKLTSNINFLYDESQKINAKNKAIDEELRRSIANMSHDLRTPLTSIIGYMQLVKAGDITEDERSAYMDIIEKRTKTLQDLISSFYDLSRLDNNEFKFNYSKVNLKDILFENIAIYYDEFIKKGIEPKIEVEGSIPSIISDGAAIKRIFINLIGNMIKHGSEEVKISLVEDEEYIVSTFTNTVENIENIDIDKLFDRFYIADKARNDNNTGLGLAIVKALANGLNNDINANLEKNKLSIQIHWKK